MSSQPGQSYEQDPRWTAVDNFTFQHLHPDSASPRRDALTSALQHSAEQGLPNIAVSAAQGKFLMLQCQLLGVEHVLEVGTLGGYSTIWLASASPSVRVTSVEVSEKHARVARENLERAGVGSRVEVVVGKGLEVLARLREEVRSGARPPFGLVFIDADKENNWAYFDLAVGMSRPRACIIVDNVVRKGTVADEKLALTDTRVQGSRLVVEKVGADKRVDAVVMQTVGDKNYDGFLMAIVKE